MTSTPRSTLDESLNESWVEVNAGSQEGSQCRSTPVHFLHQSGSALNGNMEKLLWEAQRESSGAASLHGGGSSSVSSHRDSPKSPHSPVNEPSNETILEALKDPLLSGRERLLGTDWIWDWSSRPDQQPPKDWKFHHPLLVQTGSRGAVLSLRRAKVAKRGLFSTEVLSVLFLTNIISLLLGAGIGLFFGKRFSTPINAIPLD